jgi:hypothetical protein
MDARQEPVTIGILANATCHRNHEITKDENTKGDTETFFFVVSPFLFFVIL